MKKLVVIMVISTLLTVGISFTSDNASAANFIETVGNIGVSPTFEPYDIAWNEAGTMAVVVGYDGGAGPNSYAFWPENETWYALPGAINTQNLLGVDVYSVPDSGVTTVLLVDADYDAENTYKYYNWSLQNNSVDVTIRDVYGNNGPVEGKPSAAVMSAYDIVIWVPSRSMFGVLGPGDAFNAADEGQVALYMNGGGNFLLSNIYWTDFTNAGSPFYTPGVFAYDYFGLNSISNRVSTKEVTVNSSVGETDFDGISLTQNWNRGAWIGAPSQSDDLSPGPGTICLWHENLGLYAPAGIKYDSGISKGVFFGFPFETLNQADADLVMKKALEYFVPGSTTGGGPSQPTVLLVDADAYETGMVNFYSTTINNTGASVTWWDVFTGWAINQGKPSTAVMAPYDIVIWVPSYDYQGPVNPFDSTDEANVATYLDGGGNFMLSNIYYSDYTAGGGFWSPGFFPYDYLGMSSVNMFSSQETAINGTSGDPVYGSIGDSTMNWNVFGWPGPSSNSEDITPAAGTISFFKRDAVFTYTPGGIRYDSGTFKTVYLGFPFETLTLAAANQIMNATINDFFMDVPPDVLLVHADWNNDGPVNAYQTSLNNNGVNLTVWDVYGFLGVPMGKPDAIDMATYDAVFWVPSRDMTGNPFDSIDEGEVATYLDGGGRFMLANVYYTDFTAAGSYSYTPGDFAYDYLGMNSIPDAWRGYDPVNETSGDPVYGGFGTYFLDYWINGWSGDPAASDQVQVGPGTYAFYDGDFLDPAGVYYDDGTFKTVFLGFPFETLPTPAARDQFMNMTLNWFEAGPPAGGGANLTTYTDTFWIVGDAPGGQTATVYKFEPDVGSNLQPMGIQWPFFDIAVNDDGNPLAVGDASSNMVYYDGAGWNYLAGPGLINYDFASVDYNSNDDRFYAAGKYWTGSVWAGALWYTQTGPLFDGASAFKDQSTFAADQEEFYSIAWNDALDYGLIGALFGVYTVDAYDGIPALNWTTIENSTANAYLDVSWDTDGWNEAGIVGYNLAGEGVYWRYYDTNPNIIFGYNDTSPGNWFRTGGMKPPSSPKWFFIPKPMGAIGGYRINIELNDQSTAVTAQNNFPKLYWIGLNDTGMGPKINQPIDVDSWFYFTFQGNYSQGWNNLQVEVRGWYDNGNTGVASSYPSEIDSTRNLAFRLLYVPSISYYDVDFPGGGPEITIAGVTDNVIWSHPTDSTQDRHEVQMAVYFGPQLQAGDGNGFMGAAPSFGTDPNIVLDRGNTWDFNITLRDTANDAIKNTSYGEFGVNKFAAISISGNPSGNAPPGTNNVALGSSVITYSTNTNNWVNVSIDNLYKNGVPGPEFIPAASLKVRNDNSLASLPLASDISAVVNFPGANQDLSVWGTVINGAVVSPGNGTTAHGPWGSNYNYYDNPGGTTTVNWWVDVPAGLTEGTYWSTITFKIGY